MKTSSSTLIRSVAIFATGVMLSSCQEGTQFHVSPSGDDAADGSESRPFASLERAKTAARTARETPVTVWLAGGDYHFDEPFELTAEDSGTARHPVVYRAQDGQRARLLGGRKLSAADFNSIGDEATLSRIASDLHGKIVAFDLKAAGIVNSKTYPDVFKDSGGIVDLFCNGKRMTLARFPNEGWMTFKSVIHTAGGPQGNDWNNVASFQKVAPGSSGGIFEYRDEFHDKHALWKQQMDRGIWFRGYWRVAWENSALRVLSIDDQEKTATFAKPINQGIGNKYNRPKGNGREAYQLINLLEEVDQPGEWCLDFRDQRIYFYPPAPLDTCEIVIVDERKPVVGLKGASHVTLRDLTVEFNLGDGIRVNGGEGNRVAGCTVRNVNHYAITFDGGMSHTAQSNDLYHLGAGGIWLGGGDEVSRPRIPAGHEAINNHIHHFGEIEPVYAAGINCGFTGGGGGGHHPAVGMYVAHNRIHDTPHVGVLCGSMDSVFEYNEVYRYCLVSNDMGGFYSYDYQNRNFGNLTFRHNFVHSSPLGDGIYFDHDHPDMKVIGNIVALGSSGTRGTGYLFKKGDMPKDGKTQPFDCHGNIAIDCKVGFEFVTILPHQGKIENNVAVNCEKPFVWSEVLKDKTRASAEYATGANKTNREDPGFNERALQDFGLRKDAMLLKDLPGFEQIPVGRIGLRLDKYRTTLPSRAAIEGLGNKDQDGGRGLGYDILDRK
ncbi:MAG: right-handed parallel beta-helix repeat-containing protein [Akkermansiaceae bacterium]